MKIEIHTQDHKKFLLIAYSKFMLLSLDLLIVLSVKKLKVVIWKIGPPLEEN